MAKAKVAKKKVTKKHTVSKRAEKIFEWHSDPLIPTQKKWLPKVVLDQLRPLFQAVRDATKAYDDAMTLVLAPLGLANSVKKINLDEGWVEYY